MSRNYSSTAATTELSAGVTDAGTVIVVASTSGFPTTPYILSIDAGTVNQELVLVTGVAGTDLTVTRGYDSTSAVSHLAGAVVQHSHAAIDFREAATHIDSTDDVHGVSSDVVGKDDSQILTNKILFLTDNSLSGTTAEFNAALSDGSFATLDGTETLTNKTITEGDNSLPAFSPIGSVTMFAGSSTPTGWIDCDGSEVSRSTYAALFAVIGETYGNGDGSTTFNLPDLQGRIPVGQDTSDSDFDALGETGGAKTHTLTESEMPAHDHTASTGTAGAHTHTTTTWGHNAATGAAAFVRHTPTGASQTYNIESDSAGDHTHTVTVDNAGGGGAHNNLQPYIVLTYIIRHS